MSSVSPAERTAQSRGLTIQEMSQQSGLSAYTLRYYERIGLLKPIPRNQSSGHRLYSPETVALVEKAVLEREMELMRIRLSYLDGKIRYWQAVEAGDAERVERIAKENRSIGALMK